MTKPGPKPKPTKLKQVQGNPGKRPLNKRQPKPETTPTKPWGLATHNPQVSKLWDQYAPELERLGILTGLDVGALRLALQHYQFAIEAAADIRESGGLTRIDEKGIERKHPLLSTFAQNSELYRKWATEFGLTPSSRSRLKVEPDAEQLSLADLLFQVIEDESSGK